ncbi:MAG: hypothetical protein JSS02_27980 [Planctomycetes bacterium]|nr:hypothetical protein [Planctomycetota bacterium]
MNCHITIARLPHFGFDQSMRIFFAVFSVAFALWLLVKIVNRREWWAKRTALVLALALVLYSLPFIALTVDEVVLHTNWFSKHLPAWVGDVMRTVYPFSALFGD